ncbi:MAG: M20 family metallopeptidase [Firmicutes bacterium]|nr:M20 family metallopeptidase [Bacillota bacterium]
MTNKERVSKIVDALAPELRKLALDIHDNPELGLQEYKACAWQKELLGKYGFEIEENFCDIETSYKAVYKGRKPGPKIAFLAEYDALPELGHGCGHNLIAMVSVGCGIACREFADEYGAQIDVIGTPAEETAGTKVPMSAKGGFDGYDAVMMAHPAFANAESINTIAMDAYKIEFFGRAAHAAAAPHEGINALDAMINFFNLVNAMRQQTKPDARIHGIITDGGKAANVIPDYTAANFYIRANRVADVKKLAERVRNCAAGAALGTGCTYKMEYNEENFKDTCTNKALNNLAVDNIQPFLSEPIYRLGDLHAPGSSDLGDVSYEAPAIQVIFKIGEYPNPMGGGHTPEMAAAAGSEYGINNGLNFVKGLVMTAIELMTKPEALAAVKEEFSHVNDEPVMQF